MLNWSQISGAVDRVILITLSYFVGKGYITQGDAVTITGGVVAILGVIYSIYVNRNTNLVKQAASVPDTTVVTTQDIAYNTTAPNIVSNRQVEVKRK